jgi:sugar O-acyltransferase (sialic acid O-acetyltransferase NeuD family)
MTKRDEMYRKPYVALVGGGVHGVVVADCIHAAGTARVVGYSDTPDHDPLHMRRMAIPPLGDDDTLLEQIERGLIDATILGLAGATHCGLRRRLVRRFAQHTHKWWTAIHPRAVVSPTAFVAEGACVFACATVNPLARIGRHGVVNTGAIIEHHVIVEDFAVVSPHATLCGCAHLGESAFVGAGAIILPGISIGANAVVGAGAVVVEDVPESVVVVGNPARAHERRKALETAELSIRA